MDINYRRGICKTCKQLLRLNEDMSLPAHYKPNGKRCRGKQMSGKIFVYMGNVKFDFKMFGDGEG